jgi:tripartite-type tricarboxylate transporter receptor subunit TctC
MGARMLALFATLLVSMSVAGETYPSKPIKLVVGYPPGGSGDFTTRVIADEMSKDFGVAVVAENRPGAAGNIASDFVAKSAPDGYTVLNAGNHAINKALYQKLAFDPEQDLVPVSRIATGPTVICVNNSVPVKNLQELIAYARANPGKLFNASAGYGSAPHIASALFEAAAGVKFTSVQFKGGGPAAQSLIAGDTQVMFATTPTVMGFIRAGRIRALAITLPQASPAVPGIPGAEEAGLPGYEATVWFGLYVPAGTPPAIVKRLHESVVKALAKPEVRAKIAQQGMDATPSASPEAFKAEIRSEAPLLERVIHESGAKIE